MSDKIKKIIELGICLLAFLLPWQSRSVLREGRLNSGYWEYGTIAIYAIDILLFLLLILFTAWKIFLSPKEGGKIPMVWWLLAFLEASVFISIFIAPDKLLAAYAYLRLLMFMGLFWLLTAFSFDRWKVLFSFLGGLLLQACLAIWQFFTQSTFGFKWLGLAAHLPQEYGVSVVEVFGKGEPVRWLRAYGGFDHPNILGAVMAIGILLSLGLFLISFFQNRPPYQRDLSLFALAILTSALFLSFSRSAWLGLAVGVASLAILLLTRKSASQLKKLLPPLAVIFSVFAVLTIMYHDLVFTRIKADTKLENKSKIERIESFKEAKELIEPRWLFGNGVGNYTLVSQLKSKIYPSWYYQPVHNTYLLVWAEIGLAGVLYFLLFIFILIKRSLRMNNVVQVEEGANLKLVFAAIWVAIGLMMMLDHWWWSLHFGLLLTWFMAGITYSEKN